MTSMEEGNDGQVELPLNTTANFAPLSSHPARGNGYIGSFEFDPGAAVTAPGGRPPARSDSATEPGCAEHATSNATIPTDESRTIFPVLRGYGLGPQKVTLTDFSSG
jgi:hypothetical protein